MLPFLLSFLIHQRRRQHVLCDLQNDPERRWAAVALPRTSSQASSGTASPGRAGRGQRKVTRVWALNVSQTSGTNMFELRKVRPRDSVLSLYWRDQSFTTKSKLLVLLQVPPDIEVRQ